MDFTRRLFRHGIGWALLVAFLCFGTAAWVGAQTSDKKPINPDLAGTYWTDSVVKVGDRIVYCMYTDRGRAAVSCTQVQR